jgi:hypothetical protein
MVKTTKANNDKRETPDGAVTAEPIDLSPLLDVALLMKAIFGYSSIKSLKRFRRASSCFHPHIQTFWYRFNTRQQMYYLAKYALDMLAKKPGPFRLQQIKQVLCEGGLDIALRLWAASRTVTWRFGSLLLGRQDYSLPQMENPFLSAILNLFHHQYHGNETLCQKSYHQALEHVGSMSEKMEPLLKMLVLSPVYQPVDLINAFWCQLKASGDSSFWNFSVIIEHCGKEKLPGAIRELRLCFKAADCWVRGAAIAAWVKMPTYYPRYSKKRWVKFLFDQPIDKTPGIDPSAVYGLVEMAGYCNTLQFSNLLAAIIFLFGDAYWDTNKAAIDSAINLLPHCNQEQFTTLTSALLPRLQDSRVARRRAAINSWIEMAKTNHHQEWGGWIKPLSVLFEAKNNAIHRDVLEVSVDMGKLCNNQQFSTLLAAIIFLFDSEEGDISKVAIDSAISLLPHCNQEQFTALTSALFPRLQDDCAARRRVAINAWIEMAKTNHQQGWSGWIKPLFVLFEAESHSIRRDVVKASVDVVKLFNKVQQAKWLTALRVCFQDKIYGVRCAAVRSWVEIANGDPNCQYDDRIRPLCLLLLEKDKSVLRDLIEEHPEITQYYDEKQFEDLIIKVFLNARFFSKNNEKLVDLSEKITRHCEKKRFSKLMQSLFVFAEDKDYNIRSNAILILGGMAKHCEKDQLTSLISKLFFWLSDACHFESDGAYFLKNARRKAIIYVLVWIAKCCDKKQFASVLKTVLSCLRDPEVEVKELTIKLLGQLKKHCDKEQVVELITALICCPLDDANTTDVDCAAALDKITGGRDNRNARGWSHLFWPYLSKKRAKDHRGLSAHKAATQICTGRTKYCDSQQFLALMEVLLFELKKRRSSSAVRSINEIAKRASADQRKEMMHALVKGEAIYLKVVPIIKNIIFLDRLSGITVDKAFHQPLIQLNIIQKKRDFKQEKQNDFNMALDALKNNNDQEAKILYDDLFSRSAALATIENRPVFLISFFLLKLEMFVRFSRLISSSSERKSIQEKAKTCAVFFCRYHSISMIIQAAKALPHQSFACPQAIKTAINGYLPRRVYALRKRIRPNQAYSAKASIAREALFSHASKKRTARVAGMPNESNGVTKYPRQ